jgi:hypothetical protein
MLKPNQENSNQQLLATQKSASNTPLFLHSTLTLSTNSFNLLLPSLLDSQLLLELFLIHLDYLRVSSLDLTDKSFCLLTTILFSKIDSQDINKPWHPDPKMPNNKKYQNRIVSKTGIVLGYTKKAKYHGSNTRYTYDIMIDFTGAYFANLSLLEQIELICYLNSHWQLKCHRLDVAIDDYSRKLFPVGQMIAAFLRGDNFGFQVIDDSYFDIIDNLLVGTLGIGSRRSSLFIRIYTKHRLFVRYEAELKQAKARSLFVKLANLRSPKHSDISLIKDIQKALVYAALDCIDFRDKSSIISPKNATKARTNRLPFWRDLRDSIFYMLKSWEKLPLSK